jgi:hypothetical protein
MFEKEGNKLYVLHSSIQEWQDVEGWQNMQFWEQENYIASSGILM